MSAVLTPAATTPAPARVPTLRVTQGRVLLSEFTKFRSLRSTMWTLLAAVVLMIGLGALFSSVTASQYHTYSAAEKGHLQSRYHQPERRHLRRGGLRGAGRADDGR